NGFSAQGHGRFCDAIDNRGQRRDLACAGDPASEHFGCSEPNEPALHTRPRVNIVASLDRSAPAPQARGGLPPGAMRRVREYVDAHLGESMDLAELASIAGLSVFHFARQFEQSAGITPHHYLVQRRVERAQDMLART